MFLTSSDGRVRATVALRGAGLRSLEVAGVPAVEPCSPEGPAPWAAGDLLFPWPNRLRNGRYDWDGATHQLPIDEPALGTALHGLVRDRVFSVTEQAPDRVVLTDVLRDVPGYPFAIDLAVTYRLVSSGITVELRARNTGTTAAPVALGAHPYLRVGDVPTEELVLDIDAERVLTTDARLLPVGSRPVQGTRYDPRGLSLAGARLNHCYGPLQPAPQGHRHRLHAPDGRYVELWAGGAFGWVQVYTCPEFPRPDGLVTAVAVEPMTAPPDALRSGAGVVRLPPAQEWVARWSVRLGTADGELPGRSTPGPWA